MKKNDNFYRKEDKWDYIGYAVIIILSVALVVFGLL